MKLITRKKFLVSDNSVKQEDEKMAKLRFKNIEIRFLTESNEWKILYDKEYLDGMTTPTEQVEEIGADNNPTGEMIDPTPQPVFKPVLVKPHQIETITDAQYNVVEAMVKQTLADGYTTSELLTKVLEKGIPIFIEMFGFYGGRLKKEDFELFED